MKNIELEVIRVTKIEASDVDTIVDDKRTQGAKYEVVHFCVPFDEEGSKLQVGNATGRFSGEEYKLTVIDPEMFGRFKVGQRIKLG